MNALQRQNLLDNTLVIRTSDHGEMGLAHGGLRQKCFNAYEETLRVPLVYSNPRLWSRPQTSRAMVSHVDFPAHSGQPGRCTGVSARQLAGRRLFGPRSCQRLAPPPQDYVAFTYDDWQVGQTSGPLRQASAAHRQPARDHGGRSPSTTTSPGKVPSQWEMYDLKGDPLEHKNLAHKGYKRTPAQEKQYRRLRRKLARVRAQRLRPLPTTPQPKTAGNRHRRAPVSAMD